MSGRISGGFHPCYYGLHAHIRPSVAAQERSVSCQSQNIACYCIPRHVEVVPAGLRLYTVMIIDPLWVGLGGSWGSPGVCCSDLNTTEET